MVLTLSSLQIYEVVDRKTSKKRYSQRKIWKILGFPLWGEQTMGKVIFKVTNSFHENMISMGPKVVVIKQGRGSQVGGGAFVFTKDALSWTVRNIGMNMEPKSSFMYRY